jgi:carbon monoxide dehydrogenase subunit G
MSVVHVTIEIDAPRQRVWDTIMDPRRLGDWVTIHRSVVNVSDNPLSRGSTMEQVLAMHGVSFHVKWRLVEVSAPSKAVWEGSGPAHSRAKIRYDLTGDGDGPTRFEYMNEFTPPGGRLGFLAGRILAGTSAREANHSLTRLKALLEGQ